MSFGNSAYFSRVTSPLPDLDEMGFTMSTWPLDTPRLSLAPLGRAERDALVAYRQDATVARWQSWGTDYTENDADQLIAAQPTTVIPAPGQWLQLAAHHHDSGDLVGDVAVHTWKDQPDTYELGVTIAPAWQRQGIGSEAVRRVVDWLLGVHQAHRLVAICDARNEPVARLLQSVGFRHEGRNIEADFLKGEWTSIDTYALLARERTSIG